MATKQNPLRPDGQDITSFIRWAEEVHGLRFGRLHVHQSNCYGRDKTLMCGHGPGSFELLCVPAESFAALFLSSKGVSNRVQSVLQQLETSVQSAELRMRKIPSEQAVIRAFNAWQPHPKLNAQADCAPGTCFCCDAARALSGNKLFMAVIQSIAEQIQTGEAHQFDALISAYAFGLLTAQCMDGSKDVIQ